MRLAAALILLLLAAPVTARAATVSASDQVVTIRTNTATEDSIYLLAADDGRLEIQARDLAPAAPCEATADNAVRCPMPALRIDAILGTGPADFAQNVVRVGPGVAAGVRATGAGGRDFFYGGPGPDDFDGLAGKDWVMGGAGSDRLLGGEGDDLVVGESVDWIQPQLQPGPAGDDEIDGGPGYDDLDGGPGRDRIDGGAEPDRLRFPGRTSGVRVLLGAQGGLADPEDALIENVETVEGTPYDDAIQGSGDAETIEGGDGADQVAGGGGHDALSGGDGDDLIDAREPEPTQAFRDESVICGAGTDRGLFDWNDEASDCEAIEAGVRPPQPPAPPPPTAPPLTRGPGPQPVLGRPAAAGGTVTVPVHCAAAAPCAARVRLRAVRQILQGHRARRRSVAGAVLATGAATVPAGTTATVAVELPRTLRARVRRAGRVRLVVELRLGPARWSRPLVLTRAAL